MTNIDKRQVPTYYRFPGGLQVIKSIDMLMDEFDRLNGGSVKVPDQERHANPVDLSVKLIAWTTIDHEVIGERMELQGGLPMTLAS